MPTVDKPDAASPALRCFPPAYRALWPAGEAPVTLEGGRVRIAVAPELGERLRGTVIWEGDVPPLPVFRPDRGKPLLWVEGTQRTILASETKDGVRLWFDPDTWAATLTAETLFLPNRPLWSYLPIHPHRLPAGLRAIARRRLARSDAGIPIHPLDFLIDWLDLVLGTMLGEGDPKGELVLVLSHDVDTAAGLDALGRLLEVEERAGVRSCSFVVSGRFPLDERFLDQVRRRGFEIGHHDHSHDYRTAYLPERTIEARFAAARSFLERYDVRGFRAPGWYRTEGLLRVTKRHFAYDSSFPSWRTIPKPNGCLTRRPFVLGDLPIVPLTLPPDGELLARGLSTESVQRVWREHVAFIRKRRGRSSLVHLLTHPEPGFTSSTALIDAYAEFVQQLAEADDVRCRLPCEVAATTRDTLANDCGPDTVPPPA